MTYLFILSVDSLDSIRTVLTSSWTDFLFLGLESDIIVTSLIFKIIKSSTKVIKKVIFIR